LIANPTSTEDGVADPDLETLRLVHQEVSERSSRLAANSDRIDTKATTLLGFVLAAATFLASKSPQPVLAVLGYLGFTLAGYFGIRSMRPRAFKDAPEPGPLMRDVAPRSEAAALTLITTAKVQAFEHNHKTHEDKAKHWSLSLRTLMVAALLAVLALAIGDGKSDGNEQQQQRPAPTAAP
jgi:hypothetical protein